MRRAVAFDVERHLAVGEVDEQFVGRAACAIRARPRSPTIASPARTSMPGSASGESSPRFHESPRRDRLDAVAVARGVPGVVGAEEAAPVLRRHAHGRRPSRRRARCRVRPASPRSDRRVRRACEFAAAAPRSASRTASQSTPDICGSQNCSRCRRQASRNICAHSSRGSISTPMRPKSSQPLRRFGFGRAALSSGSSSGRSPPASIARSFSCDS